MLSRETSLGRVSWCRASLPGIRSASFELIEKLDDECLSLAEIVRRVGSAAQAEGLTRPSPVHVRRLLVDLRERRRDEREIREAAIDLVERVATGRVADPFTVHRPLERAIEQADVRARRRRS